MLHRTFHLESFGVSNVGLVRDHNEDVWMAHPECRLFIVADGMGGHSAGEVASKEAAHYLYELCSQWHTSDPHSLEDTLFFFQQALTKVNIRIYEQGQRHEECKGMGTTLCALYFHDTEAVLMHVGDSRIYRSRGTRLEQLTEDHSLISELLALGAMDESEAKTFPYKHILTRAIGTHPKVESTIDTTKIESHDLFMLCSDGLTNYVTQKQIALILQKPLSLQKKGEALVNLANEQGGGDNITLVLVQPEHDLSR